MSGYIGTQPVPQATQTRQTFVATAAQTSFATAGYSVGYLDTFLNGVKLQDGVDYTATNGSDIVLTVGAALDDTLEVVAYTAFEVLDQTFTGTTTTEGLTVTGAFTSKGIDDNATSTAMTLDSSGNVLVGKASGPNYNLVGVDLTVLGEGQFTVFSNPVLQLNRQSSDGDIAVFRKDGSTVGSIGAYANEYYHGSAVGGDTFLRHGYSGVVPATASGTNRDAAIQLGSSVSRFTDLYLSGGVYLGGTGAANKLDDYEEGTWTPTIASGATGGSYTYNRGRYTKIGNFVYYELDIQASGATANGGHLQFGGLPFNSIATAPQGGGFINYQTQFLSSAGTGDTSLHIQAGTNSISLYGSNGNNFPSTGAANINARVIICGTYTVG